MDSLPSLGVDKGRHLRAPEVRQQYFNREGKPITIEQLHRLLDDPEYRLLACTATATGWVQTEFTGAHHSWTGVGKPLVFRTTIFGGRRDGEERRSSDEGEAVWCHNAWVDQLRRQYALAISPTPMLENADRRERFAETSSKVGDLHDSASDT